MRANFACWLPCHTAVLVTISLVCTKKLSQRYYSAIKVTTAPFINRLSHTECINTAVLVSAVQGFHFQAAIFLVFKLLLYGKYVYVACSYSGTENHGCIVSCLQTVELFCRYGVCALRIKNFLTVRETTEHNVICHKTLSLTIRNR